MGSSGSGPPGDGLGRPAWWPACSPEEVHAPGAHGVYLIADRKRLIISERRLLTISSGWRNGWASSWVWSVAGAVAAVVGWHRWWSWSPPYPDRDRVGRQHGDRPGPDGDPGGVQPRPRRFPRLGEALPAGVGHLPGTPLVGGGRHRAPSSRTAASPPRPGVASGANAPAPKVRCSSSRPPLPPTPGRARGRRPPSPYDPVDAVYSAAACCAPTEPASPPAPGRPVGLQPLRRLRGHRPHPLARLRRRPVHVRDRGRRPVLRGRAVGHSLPVGRHRPGRLRLLRAVPGRLPGCRRPLAPRWPGPVRRRPAGGRRTPRWCPATWSSSGAVPRAWTTSGSTSGPAR